MTSEFPLLRHIWPDHRVNARVPLHESLSSIILWKWNENQLGFFFFQYANRNTWFTYIHLCVSCQRSIPLTWCFWSPHSFNRPSNWFFLLAISILALSRLVCLPWWSQIMIPSTKQAFMRGIKTQQMKNEQTLKVIYALVVRPSFILLDQEVRQPNFELNFRSLSQKQWLWIGQQNLVRPKVSWCAGNKSQYSNCQQKMIKSIKTNFHVH